VRLRYFYRHCLTKLTMNHRSQGLITVWSMATLFVLSGCGHPRQFTEMEAHETGLYFRNQIEETVHNNITTYEYMYNGGGVAAGDVNNDGLPDIYFSGNSVPNKLYRNKGQWKFDDISVLSGVEGRRGDWKTGVTMADVNGDGWLDIYVCYSGNAPGEGFKKPVIRDHPKRSNQLFINQGCPAGGIPVFHEQARDFGLDAPGTFSTQAYFLDFDRDGDLDMFLLNHANMFYSAFFNVKRLRNLRHPYFGNKLYRNDNNKFVEISEQALIHGSGVNFGLSAAIADLNEDQWPDIYVTNDYDEQDFCYINNRNGTFKEVSHTLFGHLSKYAMGSDIADVNNDGLPEIFVADMLPKDNYRQKLLKGPDEYDRYSLAVDSGYYHQYMRNTLQFNRGFAPDSLPRFSEIGQFAGVSNTDWSWAPLLADYDNDGLKDLFITNGYLKDYTNLDFQKYIVQDAVNEANKYNHPVDILHLIQGMPSTTLSNYIFNNTDGIHFADKTGEWGLTRKSISNAAAYADIDNDGDLDLIINNLNDEISVLQNHENEIQQNHFIKIKLMGDHANTLGLGASVFVETGDGKTLYQEAYFTRGYQSSVEPVFTIGIGKANSIQKVKVSWPDGKVSHLENVTPDQTLLIKQSSAQKEDHKRVMVQPLLTDVTKSSGIDFRHKENNFVDFKSQRLALYQFSRLGGKVSVGDLNADGNDDVFCGGAFGQAGQLFFGQDNGTFVRSVSQPWENDLFADQEGSLFFDADADGDLDVYTVNGGNEFPAGSLNYQDKLYLNDGQNKFVSVTDALPKESSSGSCVRAADIDNDGDLDLFVGGRLVPQKYPYAPSSFILRNDSKNGMVRFTDISDQLNESISQKGMVTDAVWSDINNDSWPDLILVGEWMPVSVFMNRNGKKFEDMTATFGLDKSQGWWNCIVETDVDKDGDNDFLLGNAGVNIQLHASQNEPVECYSLDFNCDGQVDPVLCYYVQGKSYPLPSRDELLEQITPLRKKFINYADYAKATIGDILSKDQFGSATILKAVTLRSSWLENTGKGSFILKPLPEMAQLSAINGFLKFDLDNDGKDEILADGNFYPYRVQLGRSDASTGVLLQFQKGELQLYKPEVPLWLTGDIRDLHVVKFKKSPAKIVVARNDDKVSLFELSKPAPNEMAFQRK